jgi:hypothetical protein
MKRIALLGLGLMLGCEKTLPIEPSELAAGIVVYEHANYLGASAYITGDIQDLKDFRGPCFRTENYGTGITTVPEWNDCISSVRIASGWRATLYKHENYDGNHFEVTQDISNLQLSPGDCEKGGFNDCTTSVRV